MTREESANQGRLADLIENGKLFRDVGRPEFNPEIDRVTICGSPSMLKELVDILEKRSLTVT